ARQAPPARPGGAPPKSAAHPAARPAPSPLPPVPPPALGSYPLVGDWPAEPSGKHVTLSDTVSLDDALEKIADAAGWNLVLNTGRTGNIQLVLKLRDVPVEDALRAALSGTQLEASRRRNTVVVAPSSGPVARQPTLVGFEKPSGKRFTGEFQETDVDDALRQVAAAGSLSIVIPPGVRGEVSGVFNATPVEDALRAVLDQAGLMAELQGGVVVVREQPFGGFAGIGAEARRSAERALRDADRAMRDAQRQWGDGRDTGEDARDRVVNGDVTIRSGEEVRDVVAIRGNVRLEPGATARDVVAVLGSIKLEGGANVRDATAVLGSIEVGPGAVVERNATSVGGSVKPDPHAAIGGEQTSVSVPGLPGIGGIFGSSLLFGGGDSVLWTIGQVLAKFALFFALGLLVVALFPRRVDSVAGTMLASPWKSILTGLLGIVATPVLALLLVVTIIGIPLVAVLALLVLAAGVLGFTALAFHVGRSLPLPQRGAWVLQLAIGTAIVVLVTQIPILGGLAWIAAALITFGAAIRTRFGQQGPVLPTTVAPSV
ncbi:STN domain-containing protein, partial [Anaeromyxobacter terrae]|uniref:STN domain-containing protein n=1 Tax=Anaeromyxobacter terrae TaxID=2925406 RepID=UPI001F56D3D4